VKNIYTLSNTRYRYSAKFGTRFNPNQEAGCFMWTCMKGVSENYNK